MDSGTQHHPSHSLALQKADRDSAVIVGFYGGHPRGIRSHQWPRCRVCGAPMCHLGQIDSGPWLNLAGFARMSLFICHATGGRCEDWDPWKGANRVVLHRVRDDNLFDGPPTVRVYRRVQLTVDDPTDERAVIESLSGGARREALERLRIDKLGGGAVWWHRDDTPDSPTGKGRMRLVMQITSRIVTFDITRTGVAYVFLDPYTSGEEGGYMLWQAS